VRFPVLEGDVVLRFFYSSELNFDVLGTTNYVPSTPKGGTDKEGRQDENIAWVNAERYSQFLGSSQNEA